MKQFKILALITATIFLSSCSTVKKGFMNQKKNSSDEFLVEKKSPLIMPPNFNELPIPKEENVSIEKEENNIKKLISKNKNNNIENDISEQSKTIENSLLKKIKNK